MVVAAAGAGGARRLHHLVQIGAAETDVAQQAIIELHEVRVSAALFRTAEKR